MSASHEPRLAAHRSWPELVMHVLAHVAGTAHLPASTFDPVYVAFAERHAGTASERALGEDARTLALALPTHGELARAQLLAWLFDDVAQAMACADVDLSELDAARVVRPELRELLSQLGAPVEVLRCAALLEEEALAALPPVSVPDMSALFGELSRAAPTLADHVLVPVRALRLRGRVRGAEIWIGVPGSELALEAEHVAWQACHEATVHEASSLCGSERRAEAVAIALLMERAADAGLGVRHGVWLSHLGAVPALDPDDRMVVDQCRLARG